MIRIAICAPSASFTRDDAVRVIALAEDFPGIELHFHPQCFVTEGHFAGSDELRLSTFVDLANDPLYDVVWFARGGYGSNRIAQAAIERLGPAAQSKRYLG